MKLDNHIALRFLTDETLAYEMIEEKYPLEWKAFVRTIDAENVLLTDNIKSMITLVGIRHCTNTYYITDTVLDKFDMLKVKRKEDKTGKALFYDYSVFKNLTDRKVTFILPGNRLLRMLITDGLFGFCWMRCTPDKNKNNHGHVNWVLFTLNAKTGDFGSHFNHKDVREIEELVYKLLCFMYLSENEEVIVEAGRKYGTKKSGKLVNTLPFSITIVNSKWNITSIRTEGFAVSGHFAIRHTGEGRTIPKMVFIEPFEKKGYIRKAKNLQEETKKQ